MDKNYKKAFFAAGCFWGVEEIFFKTPGVIDTRVGYSGGQVENPTYEQVCDHNTGHAEMVEVTYNPKEVSYSQLLDVFWGLHDPTQVDRQKADIGSNYRSAIFYLDDEQKELAIESRDQLARSGKYLEPIATEITKAGVFWPAEEYHQKYFQKNPSGTCPI